MQMHNGTVLLWSGCLQFFLPSSPKTGCVSAIDPRSTFAQPIHGGQAVRALFRYARVHVCVCVSMSIVLSCFCQLEDV